MLQYTGHVYQSVLEYECEVGYELLIGEFNVECLHTKEWSARFPICRSKYFVSFNTIQIDLICYKCDKYPGDGVRVGGVGYEVMRVG